MDDDDKELVEFVNELDEVIVKWQDKFPPHNMTGILLSRITLLMTHDPATAKGLLQFVWDKMDELEQSNPGQYL
jgi:phage head maturation protease